MKNLLIMRHAKSDWADSQLSDFDRPLNSRGNNTAPIMGKELLERKKAPGLIISSPANRAKSTAEIVSKSIGYNKSILFKNELYFGQIEEIIKFIKKSDNSFEQIMIVGHNPTLEDLIDEFIIENGHYNMPTAAVVSILFDVEDWREISKKSGKIEWLIVPKELMA
jgi:phosphohistidine phosphatase